MTAQSAFDLLLWFGDHVSYSEERLKQTLEQVAELDAGTLLRNLVSPPSNVSRPVLELLLASPECEGILWASLVDDFPVIPDYFSTDLIAIMVLKKISFSVPFLHTFDRETTMKLNNYTLKLQSAPQVIEALSRFIATPNEVDDVDGFDGLALRVKQTQRARKNARTRPVIFDSNVAKACKFLNMSIPTTITDAMHHRHALAEELSAIFRSFHALFQDPAVGASIRNAFIQGSAPKEHPSFPEPAVQKLPEISQDGSQSINSAFPMVQPMKAALYFESAEGFGEWRILISTRGDRDLRDFRRRDKNVFAIIVKKIRELSNGHFSDDNQKWLSGSRTEIPIYEAKMTRDLRLIYQIDCIPEYDTDVERQVIKVFGVYTHAQIDKRLWNSLSHQLMKKGDEYRQRCCFRNQPIAGDKYFSPAYFPPMEQKADENDHLIPTIPTENLEEIHSLLVLEKFITFSQALLNSMIADLDIAHVFDVSPSEMEIIQHPHSCYVLGRSGTGKTTTMLFKMLGIQRAYEQCKETMQRPRQIFVTQSRVLAVKVEEYFTKLLESLSTGQKSKEELSAMIKFKRAQQQQSESLVDVDDDRNWRTDLPLKYSDLRDEHFPLFLTFDRLATLLEADMGITTDSDERGLLTYDRFLDSYWPHFSQSLKKGLDPVLVYSEIIGVIGGSEESLGFESHHLDKETYKNLSARTQHAFSSQREIIYALFLAYQKQKKVFGDYDAAERTHRLLHNFRASGVPGDRFDYLYVDEAQDNLLIDALLLRSLVHNPNGMFWAGDTAQTISVGSSFRFNDLKAFLFRLEKRREALKLSDGPSLIQEEPKTFHLTKNYRSHGGIVRCAHSVIELITKFWPYAIDILSREVGVVDGCKPVFFSGWDSSTVRYEQFLFGESGRPVEFGAQQCILVRNEAAREELRSQVGEIGLILTLYESKGLEFDDVLLYKFFEDSSADLSQWRVVLNMLNEECDVVVSAPTFDNTRHAGVCTELKFLYVAITRARKNLWIVDCSEKSDPMRIFWKTRNEIQFCNPGSDIPRLAVSSTPQEWEKTGRTLFTNKRYIQAMHCFERAGLDREAAVAHAYFLREHARAIARQDPSKRNVIQSQEAFCVAADAFLKCVQSAINSKEKGIFLRNAGECLERANEDFRAAEAYRQAQEFTKAAKLYRKTAKFDEAVAVVTENRSQVDTEVAENIIGVAKLFYFKSGELEKASQLFGSVEEQLQYLEDFDLDVSRAALYENIIHDYPAAAEIHLAEGRTLEAIRLFLKDSGNPTSMLRGKGCILHGLWENVSFGTMITESHDEVKTLLTLASDVLKPQDYKVDELSMFMTLQSRDTKKLRALGTDFAAQENSTSALFCLDHAFSSLPSMYGWKSAEVSHFLQDFLVFCQTLYRIASIPKPGQDPNIRKLFHIVETNSGHFMLPVGTFLYKAVLESRIITVSTNERGALISEGELARGFKSALLNRLRSRLETEGDICKQATAFQPCIPFIINNGQCNRRNCPHEHPATNQLDGEWVSLRIKIHFQQLLIMQGLRLVQIPSDRRIKQLRWWISSLFDTMFPPIHRLGHFANLDVATIPGALTAFPIIEEYCKDLIYWPGYSPREPGLLTISYQVARIAFYLNRTQAHPAVLRSPLKALLGAIPDYRRLVDGVLNPILPELMCALNGTYSQGTLCGIRVLDYILQRMLPIDANVLMDLIDIICGSLILLRRNGYLHNVTLPVSIFNNLVRVVKIDLNIKPSNISVETNMFISSLKYLLNTFVVHQQRLGHLLHERSDLYSLSSYRPVFISRICRAMCLVGYNVNNTKLREDILSSVKTLKILKPIHNLNRDYALAGHWSDIARALPKSFSDTPLDEMIQLYRASESINAKPAPRSIRRIIYKNVVDIPKLLDGSMTFSTLRPDAPTFVPKRAEVPDEGEIEVEEPEVDNSEIINSAPSTESITMAGIPEDNRPALEEQRKAANVLQTIYRRKLRYRKNGRVIDGLRASCFQQFLSEASQTDWPKGSLYRLLFLGPVPHLQVCLNAAFTWVMENKQRNKQRFKSAIHQELDDVNKRLTEQKKIIDEIKILQKAVSPQSQLHRKRDAEELATVVLRVQEMLGRVAPGVAKEVEEDMRLAIKGIVTKRKKPSPKPKPALNASDGDELYRGDELQEEP